MTPVRHKIIVFNDLRYYFIARTKWFFFDEFLCDDGLFYPIKQYKELSHSSDLRLIKFNRYKEALKRLEIIEETYKSKTMSKYKTIKKNKIHWRLR